MQDWAGCGALNPTSLLTALAKKIREVYLIPGGSCFVPGTRKESNGPSGPQGPSGPAGPKDSPGPEGLPEAKNVNKKKRSRTPGTRYTSPRSRPPGRVADSMPPACCRRLRRQPAGRSAKQGKGALRRQCESLHGLRCRVLVHSIAGHAARCPLPSSMFCEGCVGPCMVFVVACSFTRSRDTLHAARSQFSCSRARKKTKTKIEPDAPPLERTFASPLYETARRPCGQPSLHARQNQKKPTDCHEHEDKPASHEDKLGQVSGLENDQKILRGQRLNKKVSTASPSASSLMQLLLGVALTGGRKLRAPLALETARVEIF
jgi:hypothetical protein